MDLTVLNLLFKFSKNLFKKKVFFFIKKKITFGLCIKIKC